MGDRPFLCARTRLVRELDHLVAVHWMLAAIGIVIAAETVNADRTWTADKPTTGLDPALSKDTY
jgi:hypothetical protein